MAAFLLAPSLPGARRCRELPIASRETRAREALRRGSRARVFLAAEVSAPSLPEWTLPLAGEADPLDVMDAVLENLGTDAAISFSGAEDVVLVELARRTERPFRVFSLDTGRLHPETYRFMKEVEDHFDIRIEYTFPDSEAVQTLVNAKGLFSFYDDGHKECCGVRKVAPLRKKLATLNAWITGQRSDQSPSTRQNVTKVEIDPTFDGAEGKPLLKFNPLANVTSAEVWDIIRQAELPYNVLHNKGFKSIGCEPCTKPILPSQHEREGRWWWEDSTHKECGLHAGNLES